MELSDDTAIRYARHTFSQLTAVAARLGDERVNERPVGPHTNTVAAIILHCCGVTEFWLGHVGLGRASERDREGEFAKTATVAELRVAVETALAQLEDDIRAIRAGTTTSEFAAGRQFLLDEDRSDASLVIHVLEELFQHLGHAELTADVLLQD